MSAVPSASAAAQRLALAALVLGALAIALAPILVRLSETGPVATAFHRLLLALPVLGVWTAWDRTRTPSARLGRRAQWGLAIAGLCFAADLSVWHVSIGLTSIANATLLPNLAPVFVTLGAFALFGERFRPTFLVGLALAIGGAVLLTGGNATLDAATLKGDLLAALAAVFYAGYLLAVGRLRARVSTARIMLTSGAVTATALLPLALALGEPLWPASPGGWGVLIVLALVSHAAGQSLIAYALAHLPAAFSAVALLVQPAAAALLAWGLFGETLSLAQSLGAAIILGGIVIARLGSR